MRPFKLLKLFALFTLRIRSTRYTLILLSLFTFFPFLPFLPLQSVYAIPQMSDYCYIPPFVTDPNTAPNVMVVYERSSDIMKRAYSAEDFNKNNEYYGFFDSSSNYTYTGGTYYFQKSTTCTPATKTAYDTNCFSGNMLNWALMSAMDLTRKALIGFGWPDTGASTGAGEVFTYSGNFCDQTGDWTISGSTVSCSDQTRVPVSFGQYDEGAGTFQYDVKVDADNDTVIDFSYSFCLTKASGSNPTNISFIRVKGGSVPPGCASGAAACKANPDNCYTEVSNGKVGMNLTSEKRYGLIQEFLDKGHDYQYDSDGPRFGVRRWDMGNPKNADMPPNSFASLTTTQKNSLFRNILSAPSKDANDSATPYLGNMMEDIVDYFSPTYTGSIAYNDGNNNTDTQSPYVWSTDAAKKCRQTFVVFITTGKELGEYNSTYAFPLMSPAPTPAVPTACTEANLTYDTGITANACYAYQADLSASDDGTQNLRTFIVHTSFYPKYCSTTTTTACTKTTDCPSGETCVPNPQNAAQLEYAAETVGGGSYLSVDNPGELETKLREAFLNILSTSASASTVATLTTQTRESSTLTQAYFFPKREGTVNKWIGYLRLLWSDSAANLREDSENTGWLDLKKDDILSFYYDTNSVAYKARTLAVKNESPYTTINDCSPTASGNASKPNDDVQSIWNAQDRLLAKDPANRTIKVGIGDMRGFVSGSTCTGPDANNKYSGFCNFKTSVPDLMDTLQPFWNYASTCSVGDTTRWCAVTSDCNYCALFPSRTCKSGLNSACYYCSGNTSILCGESLTCNGDTVSCAGLKAGDTCGTGKCVGDCYKYAGTCTGVTGKCTLDDTRSCSVNSDCIDDDRVTGFSGFASEGGNDACISNTDVAGNTCTAAVSGQCLAECDDNCAESVIKFDRGYDKPTPSGGAFRLRHQYPCSLDTDCPGGGSTCSVRLCTGMGKVCTADSNCTSLGETCNKKVCSISSTTNNIKTLKLGDIVYSTPRIAPNSAINGYDATYGDESYKNFKGSTTVTNAMPIVIVGANDGMVHAFQVSKIKDLSPASETSESDTTTTADGSYQTARFSNDPPTADTAPDTDCSDGDCIGNELWAYIPFNAVPFLRWYCDEAYCHIPMVDARFTVIDASIDYDHDGDVDSSDTDDKADDTRVCDAINNCVWRRLLIGAMGIGGREITVGSNTWSSSVFVLDITNPASPVLLWERPLPDRTLTAGTPAVVRLSTGGAGTVDTENGRWYLVFGSGPTSITTNAISYKSTNAKLFVFDLRDGANQTKGADNADMTSDDGIDIGASGVAVGDMTAVDFDSDYKVDDVYFGTYGGTGASQTGNFYRLRLRNNETTYQLTPSDWYKETVVSAERPIFAAPEVAVDSNHNKWVYFGTGLYLTLEHVAPTAYCNYPTSSTTVCTADSDCPSGETCEEVSGYLEYLYGVKEPDGCWKGTTSPRSNCTHDNTYFLDTSNIKFTGAKAAELGCFCAGQLMSTIACDSDGTCTGSCGNNKICNNNTTQSCNVNGDCPSGGSCIENKVILKVNNASITNTGPTSPNDCTNKTDTDAVTCIENNVNNVGGNGCDSNSKACQGWRREIKGQKMFSRPFVAGGLVDFTSFQPTTITCSLGGNAHLIALHYTTGSPYAQPTIFVSGGTSGATTNLEIKASVNLGTGVPPLGESLVALPLAGDTYKVITQVSGGLPGTSMAPSLPATGGYVLWIIK